MRSVILESQSFQDKVLGYLQISVTIVVILGLLLGWLLLAIIRSASHALEDFSMFKVAKDPKETTNSIDPRQSLGQRFKKKYETLEFEYGSKRFVLFPLEFLSTVKKYENRLYLERISSARIYSEEKKNRSVNEEKVKEELWMSFLISASRGKAWEVMKRDNAEEMYIQELCRWGNIFIHEEIKAMHTSALDRDSQICTNTQKLIRVVLSKSILSPIIDPSDHRFEEIHEAFLKLSDFSLWSIKLVGFFSMSFIRRLAKWLTDSQLQTLKKIIAELMKSLELPRQQTCSKRELEQEVIYRLLTLYSETFFLLVTSFYDLATRPEIRKSVRGGSERDGIGGNDYKGKKNFDWLKACILESYRLCPPICSALWVVRKSTDISIYEDMGEEVVAIKDLEVGELLGFCSPAVYKSRHPQADGVSQEGSSGGNSNKETRSLLADVDLLELYSPLKNWENNNLFQNDLLVANQPEQVPNLVVIHHFLSSILQKADFSTFEWGKPALREMFLLYPTLHNSSMIFKLHEKN